MNKQIKSFSIVLLGLVFIPFISLAQTQTPEFTPLVGIPGVDPNDPNFGNYINALYALSISLAALLAVIKIIIAGVKWMLTDIVTSKENAKKDIQGAVLGLLIIISAVVVLNFINPQLTQTDLFLEPVAETTTQVSDNTPRRSANVPYSCSYSASICDRLEQECRARGGVPTRIEPVRDYDYDEDSHGSISCSVPF